MPLALVLVAGLVLATLPLVLGIKGRLAEAARLVGRGRLARVDDAHDMGMVELRDCPRLAAEALELVGVRGDLAVHELDRDLALEHRVEGAIDGRHPPGADLGVEPVTAGEQGADLRAHRSIVRMWAPFM